ncbi:DNA polymerase III subunit alpha [Chryseobacterium sp. 6424]|uniref:DNA polymerase III subunit alpha n=1 Tax=Chryseobacterium sp. 6424 TaxID=2039166 RepID=UPI000EFD27D6|nr:DNA polymerase III subunit alpha [Chryseobacterium sp. 6424]AYO57781.1 DNA polymerase III subunit alpha [Chryseobacterium sp. 6424]
MYLIFDTETTGLPKNFNAPLTDSDNWPRMVQIAWQLHDKDGNLIENQDYIIKPEGYDIPYNATRIHGISTRMAHAEGRDLAEVLEEFQEVLSRTEVVAGHNIDFDYKIVGAEFIRKNQTDVLKDLPAVDTMEIGRDFCKLGGGKNGKYKSPKLEELYAKLYDEKFDEAHNAAADVNATAQVFFEMMRIDLIPASQLKITDTELRAFISSHPHPVQPFNIKIRRQVADSKKKKKVDFGDQDEIELGDYFNFHNHSIYSSLQSSTHIKELVDKALKDNYAAVGLVDLGNMMGAFKFVAEVEKANNTIKANHQAYLQKKEEAEMSGEPFHEPEPRKNPLIPVIGCEFYLSDRPEQKQFTKDNPDRRTNVVLLAKNFNGYKNLAKLSSLGFVNGFYFGVPRISKKMVAQYKEDLIAFTAGISGDVPSTVLELGEQKGEEVFRWWKDTFKEDFYVQLQNHGIDEEDHLNEVLLSFADQYEVKIIAQNETFYTEKADANIQDILYCIKDGEKLSSPVGKGFGKRRGLPTNEFYIKSAEELKQTFNQFPDAFEAYTELLAKFEAYTLKRDVLLPEFDIPTEFLSEEDKLDGGKRGENAYLRHLTYEGAAKRYDVITDEIRERLDFELEVIANTGYPGYFLIVQDFCNEARNMGVWVGPGRGSAAGSAVAYCIGITNVDPIKYDLLFERFLNPERISMPDIDIDFDDEGRDKIIKWVVEKYGKTNVAQIITYSVLGGKSAIKDAGRVLDVSIPETNNIAKLIPSSPGMNIAKAFSKFDKLSPEDKMLAQEMKDILAHPDDSRYAVLSAAQRMEGCIRNTGIHACGVIITPEDISNLVPISIAAKDPDILVSQFDNSVAESAGLLKMDFLGLRTLTIIKHAIKLIRQRHGIDINPDTIPLDDIKTYQLFQEGRTIGIFQYESPGMQKYMRELKPTKFADLIAMNALYRPGPIKYIPNFINRKHGLEEIVYDLEETKEYLEETYGITVYQEQVMLLSQKLANFTKGEADTLRKAMGKKDRGTLDKMYPKFIAGGEKNNLDVAKLNKIWKDWEAFAEYAFNKSHSTCYALIAYQTAYLKANYPAEYMASVMTNNLNNTKQITMFMEDCKSMGVDVLGPAVNESQYEFSVNDRGQIRFGLGAIKGIGEGPSEAIVNARKTERFQNIYDFFEKIPSSQINKRVAESLVIAGAFDEVDKYHRAQYFDADISGRTNIERLLRYGQSFQESKNEIENSLFADFAEEVKIEPPKINPAPEWQTMHKLNKEKEIIGFYLSAHPLDEYRYQFQFLNGALSKKEVLEGKKEEETTLEKVVLPVEVADTDEDLVDLTENLDVEEETLLEEPTSKAEPKGSFNFLNLDEVEAFKDTVFAAKQPDLFTNDNLSWKEKQAMKNNTPEYMVAGLVTEYSVRDGKNSGEKVAFITLEDYSGSYSFRLGDRDYMRLRDKIEIQRFVIFKIKFSQAKDGRVFVNVAEVIDLKDAFEKFAKKMTVIVDVNDLRKDDIAFFKEYFSEHTGEQKLNFLIKNPADGSMLEMMSLKSHINISGNLLQIINETQKFEVYLN